MRINMDVRFWPAGDAAMPAVVNIERFLRDEPSPGVKQADLVRLIREARPILCMIMEEIWGCPVEVIIWPEVMPPRSEGDG